jgi:hypothetical protein
MKIPTRMLGIATLILWVTIIFFSVTAAYSVMQLGINIGQVQILPSSEGINFSLPFSIINNGYYELADLNLTTLVKDSNGTTIDHSETLIPSIPMGTTVNATHTIPINLDTIMSTDPEPLLLNDSFFEIEIFAGLNFARAIPVQLSTNYSIPWGAPLSNFALGEFDVSPHNSTHARGTIPLSFGNHAVLDLVGLLQVEIFNDSQELIAIGETPINVPAGESYDGEVNVYPRLEDVAKLSGSGTIHVIFETPLFVVDWDEPYG